MADMIGNERTGGQVLAVFQMATDTGAIIGPVLAGMLADRLGYGWAFGVTGRHAGLRPALAGVRPRDFGQAGQADCGGLTAPAANNLRRLDIRLRRRSPFPRQAPVCSQAPCAPLVSDP